ncbi:mucin-3A [Bombina bombina]|uniref:mucin-3A n=1 Tax=Bombina bombina TaxID=8345 RepID=UPI00235AB52B|nr:mucin-3A [Bombina bombina]
MIRFFLLLLLLPGAELLASTDELEKLPVASPGAEDNMPVTSPTTFRKSASTSSKAMNKGAIPQSKSSKHIQKPQLLKVSHLVKPAKFQPVQGERRTDISTNIGSLTSPTANIKPSKMSVINSTGTVMDLAVRGLKSKKPHVLPVKGYNDKNITFVQRQTNVTMPEAYTNISSDLQGLSTTLKVKLKQPRETTVQRPLQFDVVEHILESATVASKVEKLSSIVHSQLSQPQEKQSWVNRISESMRPISNQNLLLDQFHQITQNSSLSPFLQEKGPHLNFYNSLSGQGNARVQKTSSARFKERMKDNIGVGMGTQSIDATTLSPHLVEPNHIISKSYINHTGVHVLASVTGGNKSIPTVNSSKINVNNSLTNQSSSDNNFLPQLHAKPQDGIDILPITTQKGLEVTTMTVSYVAGSTNLKVTQPGHNLHRHTHPTLQVHGHTSLLSATNRTHVDGIIEQKKLPVTETNIKQDRLNKNTTNIHHDSEKNNEQGLVKQVEPQPTKLVLNIESGPTIQNEEMTAITSKHLLIKQNQTEITMHYPLEPYTITKTLKKTQSKKNVGHPLVTTQTQPKTSKNNPLLHDIHRDTTDTNQKSQPSTKTQQEFKWFQKETSTQTILESATQIEEKRHTQAEPESATQSHTKPFTHKNTETTVQTETFTQAETTIKNYTNLSIFAELKFAVQNQTEPQTSPTQSQAKTSTQTNLDSEILIQTEPSTQTKRETSVKEETLTTEISTQTQAQTFTQKEPELTTTKLFTLQQRETVPHTQTKPASTPKIQTEPSAQTEEEISRQTKLDSTPQIQTESSAQTEEEMSKQSKLTTTTQMQKETSSHIKQETSTQTQLGSATQIQIVLSTNPELETSTQAEPQTSTQTQASTFTLTIPKSLANISSEPYTQIVPKISAHTEFDFAKKTHSEMSTQRNMESSTETQPEKSTYTETNLTTPSHTNLTTQKELSTWMQPALSMETKAVTQKKINQSTQPATGLADEPSIRTETQSPNHFNPMSSVAEFTIQTQPDHANQTQDKPSRQTHSKIDTHTQTHTALQSRIQPSTITEVKLTTQTQTETYTINQSSTVIKQSPASKFATQTQLISATKTELNPNNQKPELVTQTEATFTMKFHSEPTSESQPAMVTQIQNNTKTNISQTEPEQSTHILSELSTVMLLESTTYTDIEPDIQTHKDKATDTPVSANTHTNTVHTSVPWTVDLNINSSQFALLATSVAVGESQRTRSWHGRSHNESQYVTQDPAINFTEDFFHPTLGTIATDDPHRRMLTTKNILSEEEPAQSPEAEELSTPQPKFFTQLMSTTLPSRTFSELLSTPSAKHRISIVDEQPPVFKVQRINITYRIQLTTSCEQPDPCQSRALQEVTSLYEIVPGFDGIELLNTTLDKTLLEYRVQIAVQTGSVISEAQVYFLQDPFWLFGSSQALENDLRSKIRSISLAEEQADPCNDWFSCPEGYQCMPTRLLSAHCLSPCHRGFCHNHGICIHQKDKEPECQCPIGRDFWYMGQRCDYRMTHQRLAAIACAIVFCIIICAVAAVFLLVRRFQQQIMQQKLAQTQSSYRRFSRFDDVPTHFWCPSQTWLTTSASLNSLDNPAFSSSEEVFPLQALGSCVCGCQDGVQSCDQTNAPPSTARVLPRLETSCSSVNDLMIDSGKASDVSVSSWPMEPIHWTPFPILHQLSLQSPFHARRPHSYFEGMELVNTERSWTA